MRPLSAAFGLKAQLDAVIVAGAVGDTVASVVVCGGAAGVVIACAVRAWILALPGGGRSGGSAANFFLATLEFRA